MKLVTALLLVPFAAGAASSASAAAPSQLLKAKGAKATMTVTYEYKSAGKEGEARRGTIEEWDVVRVVTVKATYVADMPLPMAVMHQPDDAAKAKMASQQAQAQQMSKKMSPMAGDMMALAKSCGMSDDPDVSMTPAQEKAFEACVEKKTREYGDNMQAPADMQQTSAAITAMGDMGAPRYQLWRLSSLTGDYHIKETQILQVFEMTCTATRICKRTITTNGSGEIPQPPGGRSIAGASMLEVDSVGKDFVFSLPAPLAPLKTSTTVETSIPNDKTTGGPTNAKPLLNNQKPITVKIPADALKASGNEVIRMEGAKTEKGILTVTWNFSAQ